MHNVMKTQVRYKWNFSPRYLRINIQCLPLKGNAHTHRQKKTSTVGYIRCNYFSVTHSTYHHLLYHLMYLYRQKLPYSSSKNNLERTNGRTDPGTDVRTDTTSYRDAWSHLIKQKQKKSCRVDRV